MWFVHLYRISEDKNLEFPALPVRLRVIQRPLLLAVRLRRCVIIARRSRLKRLDRLHRCDRRRLNKRTAFQVAAKKSHAQ